MIVSTEEKCGKDFLIGVITDGGSRGGMYSFLLNGFDIPFYKHNLWPLFSRAGLATSAPVAA
jgi:hypothetical protein